MTESGAFDAARVQRICAELGLVLTEEQRAAMLAHLALLGRWNATYNLTAVRDPGEMVSLHLADCLSVIGPLGRHARSGRLLDVGSGGGLPGVVIAIALPDWEVTCVDAVAKKVAFVRQAGAVLRLPNLQAQHSRAEVLRTAAPFDVIIARAFSTLADLVALTKHHLAKGGVWVAMKGRQPNVEITGLGPEVEVFHVEPLRVPGLAAQRCLVWMRLRSDTGTGA